MRRRDHSGSRISDRNQEVGIARCLHSLGLSLPFDDQIKIVYQSIASPVCLIRATQGVKYPQEVLERRKSYFKHLEYHELPGGHHVHMDNAQAVADILNSWL